MKNPYFIDEPCAISLSGGRTSAYMLRQVLEANQGLPADCTVLFANTGKELPETLDFVNACSVNWGIPVTWVELHKITRTVEPGATRGSLEKEYKIVDYETASRAGDPFTALLTGMPAIPNVTQRTCTSYMKIKPMMWALDGMGYERPVTQLVGIRADEPRRAHKILAKPKRDGAELELPLFHAGVTAGDVGEYWAKNDFDLALPNNNGVTDWGNCDLCFLKSYQKKISIIRQRPDLASWWIEAETYKQGAFRLDHPDYASMLSLATETDDMFEGLDESIPCFCGE